MLMQGALSGWRSRQVREAVFGHHQQGIASERRLRLPIILSCVLHAGLIAALLLWFRHTPPVQSGSQTEGAVELLLVEHKGSGTPATAEPMPPAAVPAPAVPPVPPPPAAVQVPPTPPAPASPPIPQIAAAQELLPIPAPPSAPPTAPSQPSDAKPEREAPRISLGGSDETDAVALGPHIIPASVDAKYHNREPVYPPDAARRSEEGTVILLIHVSSEGLPMGVDIEQTSGFTSLDRAARDAVMTWHFLPGIRDGRPIAFDMALRVMFHLE